MSSDDPHPYPSYAVGVTHPARLRTWASLHGVGAWTTDPFRFLEIGCGNGTNLLALADAFPESAFVGVDKDPALIALARRAAADADIANAEFVVAELSSFGPVGASDFVVAHGVYSWLSEADRDRLLSIVGKALAPLGVAYLSYNTYPGWAIRGVVRDVMREAARGERTPADKLRAGKARVAELQRRLQGADHPYATLLGTELTFVQGKPDGYLLDEHLAEQNHPAYFHEVARHAAQHGLRYVCEMMPGTPDGKLEREVPAELMASGMSRIDAEQCLDVVAYRQFRSSLFAHEGVSVADEPNFHAIADHGYFAGALDPSAEEPLLGPGRVLGFRAVTGAEIQVERPLLKAALLAIADAWPSGIAAREVIALAIGALRERGLLSAAAIDEEEIQRTVGDLVELCRRRLIEILPWRPEIRRDVPDRPAVRRLARVEAERSSIVTTPRHEPAALPEPLWTVARLLDGSRDLRAVVTEISRRIDGGELTLDAEVPMAERTKVLADLTVSAVSRLRDLGLLAPDAPPPSTRPGGSP